MTTWPSCAFSRCKKWYENPYVFFLSILGWIETSTKAGNDITGLYKGTVGQIREPQTQPGRNREPDHRRKVSDHEGCFSYFFQNPPTDIPSHVEKVKVLPCVLAIYTTSHLAAHTLYTTGNFEPPIDSDIPRLCVDTNYLTLILFLGLVLRLVKSAVIQMIMCHLFVLSPNDPAY